MLGPGQVQLSSHSDCKPRRVNRTRSARHHVRSYTSSAEWQKANPSFDDIDLNDEYYNSLGISPEELADQLSFQASDADPDGQDIGVDGPLGEGTPAFLHDQDLETDIWGPEVSCCRQSMCACHTTQHCTHCHLRIVYICSTCRLWF